MISLVCRVFVLCRVFKIVIRLFGLVLMVLIVFISEVSDIFGLNRNV